MDRNPHDNPPPVLSKSGEGYDRCPVDGCIEVDASYTNGGVDGKGGGHYDWFQYSADPRKGGCGCCWTRDTPQGYARNVAKGVNPMYQTTAGEVGRVYSVPSPRFQDNYSRIFGHD